MSRMHRKSAAALAYDAPAADGAPRVVAKGYGLVADMIIARAKEAGLYVHESPEMMSLLMQVDLDSKIPPQLYQAVAELLAWLHQLEAVSSAPPPAPEPAPDSASESAAAAPDRAAAQRRASPFLSLPPLRTSSSD